MKNKYIFFKKLFPNSIILFKIKDKYKVYKNDKLLIEYIKFKTTNDLEKIKINYIIVNELKIENKKIFKNNNYYKYYYQSKINMILFLIDSC